MQLLGRIAAGSPVEAIAGHDTLSFSDFVGDPNTYALQVRGESMIEDHIMGGDYVLVEKAGEARDGDIVVAVPAKNALIVTGPNNAAGLARLRAAASRFAAAPNGLTAALFVYRGGKFARFDAN